MAGKLDFTTDANEPAAYQIRLQGHLGPEWAAWFGGLTVTLEEQSVTLLTGPVADQAALHGLLKKVRDLSLPLLLVNCVESGLAAVAERNEADQSRSKQASST